MPFVIPKHTCGHSGSPFLSVGDPELIRRNLVVMESFPCPPCRRKAADEEAVKQGLPFLTGTDKQVAWASDIRKEAMKRPQFRDVCYRHTRAEWWIDNKKTSSIK